MRGPTADDAAPMSDQRSTWMIREDRRDGAPQGAAPRKRRLQYKMLRRAALHLPSLLPRRGKETKALPRAIPSGPAERCLALRQRQPVAKLAAGNVGATSHATFPATFPGNGSERRN